MDGLLVIDKPEGPTSHDVVARARRVLRERRIGHTGTLDPLATGVLPLLLGRATRLARFLTGEDKRYVADIRFGTATTTYDRAGEPVGGEHHAVALAREDVEKALERFRGTFPQTPPPYSAKKVGGVSAHRLARRGAAPELAAVTVTVHELTLVELTGPDARIELRCSAGFYVRSLAHDLGSVLGCGAHLRALRRTAAGSIALDDAMPLAEMEARPEEALRRIQPLSRLLTGWPAARLTAAAVGKVRQGRPLEPGDYEPTLALSPSSGPDDAGEGEAWVRLLDPAGALVALATEAPQVDKVTGVLHPRIVLVYD